MINQTYDDARTNIILIEEKVPGYLTHANRVRNVSDRIANIIHGLGTAGDEDELFDALKRLTYSWGEALEALSECHEDFDYFRLAQQHILRDLSEVTTWGWDNRKIRRSMQVLYLICPRDKFRKWLMRLAIGKDKYKLLINYIHEMGVIDQ